MSTVHKITTARALGLKAAFLLVVLNLGLIISNGFNFGVEFTGGVLTRFASEQAVTVQVMQNQLNPMIDGEFSINSESGNTVWTVRQGLDEQRTSSDIWLSKLNNTIAVKLLDSDFIGPQIGQELIEQGGLALMASLIVILLYLATRFEWRLATGAIIALMHDVIVVLGVFATLGLEFNLTVLAAILAVIGYSLNDSIIVADRMRELLRLNKNNSLNEIVDAAVSSTMTRTLITSGTTLATIGAIWWLGGQPLQGFAIALFVGILVGTFSSICICATVPGKIGLKPQHYQPIHTQ